MKRYKKITKPHKNRFAELLANKDKIFKELEVIVLEHGWASLDAYLIAQAYNIIAYVNNKKIVFAGL